MKVLVTGASGFIGKNLIEGLSRVENLEVIKFDRENSLKEIEDQLNEVDFIYNLAGINRPTDPQEFYSGNKGFIEELVELIERKNLNIPILITSSIQAERDNDYGKSKLGGENILKEYRKRTNADIFIYRLPNVFGKWCRPNYNSVVATWCHNVANGLPITISDRTISLNFVYIDDIVKEFIKCLKVKENSEIYYSVPISYEKTLGEISDLLEEFKENRNNLIIPQVGKGFERALYATYLSYLPKEKFSYELLQHSDERGSFVEILKTVGSGQFSISTSKPGVTRGNHYHNTKNEKFLVIKGEALLKFRHINSDEVIEYPVSDKKLEVVDIPTGYTHSITNTGNDEMILVLWANEQFDKENPDTYYLEV